MPCLSLNRRTCAQPKYEKQDPVGTKGTEGAMFWGRTVTISIQTTLLSLACFRKQEERWKRWGGKSQGEATAL